MEQLWGVLRDKPGVVESLVGEKREYRDSFAHNESYT